MSERVVQIMIVPDRSASVRRFRVPYRRLKFALFGAVFLVGLLGFLGVNYFYVVGQARHNRTLKDENNELRASLRIQQEEIERISSTLQRIGQFASKVRTITRLSDPERNLAIGPLAADPSQGGTPTVMYAKGERIDVEDEHVDSGLALRLMQLRLESADADSREQEKNLRDLQEYFASDTARLTSTPTIRPISSELLNSAFGPRTDPYTGQRVMHKGVDFAAEHGSDVFATADGTVVFAGSRGKYGKTLVVDHGYGLQTHFAHLSTMKVAVGDQVKRGQVIGGAGTTGRTTGVHLHYEIRLNGVPLDPERFFVD